MTAEPRPVEPALLAAIGARRQTFRDVTVFPSQGIHLGSVFQGGPLWPRFGWRILARHCHYAIPYPVDARPREEGSGEDVIDEAVWCGPVMNHYGHMIADFGMRIAASAHVDPVLPLLFSLFEVPDFAPEAPFFSMLDQLGVDRRRLVFVRRPTRVRVLHVHPQAERRHGGGPSTHHLDFMDRIAGGARTDQAGEGTIFVSRSRFSASATLPSGQIAGERYLDRVIERAGIRVVHPETMDVPAQTDLYARTSRIVFSEGSALHTLQLMGRLSADVVVLARRSRQRVAESSLRPRLRALTYLYGLRGLIHGCDREGRPYRARAIAVLDERLFLARMAALGIDLTPWWRDDDYRAAADPDVRDWMAKTHALAMHPDTGAMIDRSMKAIGFRLGEVE